MVVGSSKPPGMRETIKKDQFDGDLSSNRGGFSLSPTTAGIVSCWQLSTALKVGIIFGNTLIILMERKVHIPRSGTQVEPCWAAGQKWICWVGLPLNMVDSLEN